MMAMMFYFILQLHSAINYGMKFSYCKSYLLCSTKHAQATEHTGQRKIIVICSDYVYKKLNMITNDGHMQPKFEQDHY